MNMSNIIKFWSRLPPEYGVKFPSPYDATVVTYMGATGIRGTTDMEGPLTLYLTITRVDGHRVAAMKVGVHEMPDDLTYLGLATDICPQEPHAQDLVLEYDSTDNAEARRLIEALQQLPLAIDMG